MYMVDRNAMLMRKEELRISWVLLQQFTRERDPENKGVSEMTLRRVLTETGETKLSTFFLICECLDIDPRVVIIHPNNKEVDFSDDKINILSDAIASAIRNSPAVRELLSE